MTRTEHLLTILAEECCEVAQRASKALRFGLAEAEPGQELTNAQRIVDEMNDLTAVYMMLVRPDPDGENDPLFRMNGHAQMAAIRSKREKVERFLRYSFECGALDAPADPPNQE